METKFENVVVKDWDYKVCKKCNGLNWYENTECFHCESKKFKPITTEWINNEYLFWKTEGYLCKEIDEQIYNC